MSCDGDCRLLSIPFYTISDYMYLLMRISKELATMGPKAMVFLAAAVSDFYLPEDKLVPVFIVELNATVNV